ncbi:MAG TPA: hypothetical protein VFD58_27545 [Blastocatellia bacterium]|nr:hypothetical protein [Blastocatellia bacterium]
MTDDPDLKAQYYVFRHARDSGDRETAADEALAFLEMLDAVENVEAGRGEQPSPDEAEWRREARAEVEELLETDLAKDGAV